MQTGTECSSLPITRSSSESIIWDVEVLTDWEFLEKKKLVFSKNKVRSTATSGAGIVSFKAWILSKGALMWYSKPFFLLTAHCTKGPKCSHRTNMIQETWQAFSSMILQSWCLIQAFALSAVAEHITSQILSSSAEQVGCEWSAFSVLSEIYTVQGSSHAWPIMHSLQWSQELHFFMPDWERGVYTLIPDKHYFRYTWWRVIMFVVKLHLPGLATVLKKWFETKEAPKHFTPTITILREREWASNHWSLWLLFAQEAHSQHEPFDYQLS